MFSTPSGGGNSGNEVGPTGNPNALSVTMTPPISTKFAHNQRVAVCTNGGGTGDKGKNRKNTNRTCGESKMRVGCVYKSLEVY